MNLLHLYRPRAYLNGPAWLRACRLNIAIMRYLSWWFFGIVLLATVVALVVYAAIDTPQVSIIQFAQHGGLWFPFSIAVMMTTTVLQVWVANGGTRRSYLRGSILAAIVIGVSFAVMITLLLVLERALFEQWGWVHGSVEDAGAASAIPGGIATHLVGMNLLYVAGTVSGLLVGIVYARFKGWWGTLTLPLTVAPILIIGAFLLHPSEQWRPWFAFPDDERPSWATIFTHDFGPFGPVLGVLVIAAAAAAFAALARRIPIANKES